MFYKCYNCKRDIVTDFEETHYHLKLTKSSLGIEENYIELTLCKDCFKYISNQVIRGNKNVL